MKSQQAIITIVVGILGILTLIYLLFVAKNQDDYNWMHWYDLNSDNPYGLLVAKKILPTLFQKHKTYYIEDDIDEKLSAADSNSSYVFIGSRNYLDSSGRASLIDFVSKGNVALLSQSSFNQILIFELYNEPCEVYDSDGYYDDDGDYHLGESVPYNYWSGTEVADMRKANFNFVHPGLLKEKDYEYEYRIRKKRLKYKWDYFSENSFCEGSMYYEAVGYMGNDSLNMIRIPKGKGFFYLHATPITFTNINLITDEGKDYASKVFSHLPEGDIYWDEDSRSPEYRDFDPSNQDVEIPSPLSFVLAQKSLAWSWYVLLSILFLYVLFGSKRRQKVIPVLEENSNTSLEFIETVGRLYMQQNNHKKLAEHKMKLFLMHVRDHFKIPTQHQDEKFMKRISGKSGVPIAEVKNIFRMWSMIKSAPTIADSSLITFHHKLDEFYRKSK